MQTWDELLEATAEAFDVFAGTIEFTPRGGSAVEIEAIVTRSPAEPSRQSDVIYRPVILVDVKNSASVGVLLSNATTLIGGKFTIARRQGHAEMRDLTIKEDNIKTQDAGRILFEFGA